MTRSGRRHGRVVRFHPDVSVFGAVPAQPGASDWEDAAALVGPGGVLVVLDAPSPPPDWQTLTVFASVQMVDAGMTVAADGEARPLRAADVPEMLDLVARTQPGPFQSETIGLGGYLGIRRGARLVAMAGQRMRPPGWTEISAVCTDEAFRGQGLGTRLIRAVAAGIRARDEIPFLHALADNPAVGLYEALGFRLRRTLLITVLRAPGGRAGSGETLSEQAPPGQAPPGQAPPGPPPGGG
jgi:ribosomal protein S18 acetylase RimI-like enzyme